MKTTQRTLLRIKPRRPVSEGGTFKKSTDQLHMKILTRQLKSMSQVLLPSGERVHPYFFETIVEFIAVNIRIGVSFVGAIRRKRFAIHGKKGGQYCYIEK